MEKMTNKNEVLEYLSKQINEKKAVIEFTRKQPHEANHDIFIEDWKEEMRILLSTMEIVLETL